MDRSEQWASHLEGRSHAKFDVLSQLPPSQTVLRGKTRATVVDCRSSPETTRLRLFMAKR